MDIDNYGSNEEKFYHWLSKRITSNQLISMHDVFSKIDAFCLKEKILKQHLFETTDETVLIEVRDTIEHNSMFELVYEKQRRLMSIAIREYLLYIKEGNCTDVSLERKQIGIFLSKDDIVVQNKRNKTEEESQRPKETLEENLHLERENSENLSAECKMQYLKWFVRCGNSNEEANRHCLALENYNELLKKRMLISKDIFQVNSLEELRELWKKSKTDIAVVKWISQNIMILEAVHSYSLYLKSLEIIASDRKIIEVENVNPESSTEKYLCVVQNGCECNHEGSAAEKQDLGKEIENSLEKSDKKEDLVDSEKRISVVISESEIVEEKTADLNNFIEEKGSVVEFADKIENLPNNCIQYVEGLSHKKETISPKDIFTEQKYSREELRTNFEDKRKIKKDKIREEYRQFLIHSNGNSPLACLKNKIIDQFVNVSLLCEIEINDDEYNLLCEYVQKKYKSLLQDRQNPTVDIIFTVGMVQIGIRTYDSTFWPHIAEVIGVENIPISKRVLLGECVMQTLLAFGKSVSEGKEYVTTILMHGFIVDSYAYRVFNYLFQYYSIDLKRDIGDLNDEDIEYLCDSIINPYAKRQQLLSNYMGMSIRAEKEFTVGVLTSILKLIDQNFWNEYTEDISLSGRLESFFQSWKKNSAFYKTEKEKNNNNLAVDDKKRNFRTPQLQCDMNNAEFSIVLPKQLIRDEIIEDGESFYWEIASEDKKYTIQCKIEEGFSGYSTYEEVIYIEPIDQFKAYYFFFLKGKEVLRKFVWKSRRANFFTCDGIWVNSERINPGELFAYSAMKCGITSDGLLGISVRNGLNFYEFSFAEGSVISIDGEANYYVGQVPANGISKDGLIKGVSLISNGVEYSVYRKIPDIIFSAEEGQLNGIAVIVNGVVSHIERSSLVNLQIENCNNRYYFLNSGSFKGIKEGINQILIDFPATSKRIALTFAYIHEFFYEFEDAPYVFQSKGTLKINLSNSFDAKIVDEKGSEVKDFKIADLIENRISREIQITSGRYKLVFDVPILEYSIDGKNWNCNQPMDCWHNDLPSIYYVKCPANNIRFCVDSSDGYQSFTYNKNSKDMFVCDITKLKTYLYDGHIIKNILIQIDGVEYDFIKIIMKSYLVNVILEADIENGQLTVKFDILGKNVYYADIKCEDKFLMEKEPIIEGKITLLNSIVSSEYVIIVYEQEDEFAFDEDYTYVGSKTVSIINPLELIGRRFRLQNLEMRNGDVIYDVKSDYYGYLEEKIDNHHYNGFLIEVFHENSITQAFEVIVYIPDLNHLEQIDIQFIDEYREKMEFEYDHYTYRIVEEELKNISKSKAYRRYEVLYSDTFVWNISYDQTITDYIDASKKIIQNSNNKSKEEFTIWNNNFKKDNQSLTIGKMDLSIKTYNALNRAKLQIVADVVDLYKNGTLYKVRNLDRQSYIELVKKLKEFSLI